MARRPLALPPAAIDRWCQYVQDDVSHIAEATGFVNFELSFDEKHQHRVISPKHYIITFSSKDKARQRYHSSLLTLRLVPESSLPEQVQVGVEVRGRGGESVVCTGEYVEFELLSLVNDASKQPPLRIASGPVRVNPETQQREFMRIDLGRCVRQIITDIVDDPKHKGQKLVRSRWWICVEVLRLVCSANSLDCSALDSPSAVPLEWVICLADEKGSAAATTGAQAQDAVASDEKSIDELAKFIDGSAKRNTKARQRRKKKGEDAPEDGQDEKSITEVASEPTSSASLPSRKTTGPPTLPRAGASTTVAGQLLPSASPLKATSSTGVAQAARSAAPPRPSPPPGWSRTVDLAPALVDMWHDSAGCDVRHVAESTGFVHFFVEFSAEQRRRIVTPGHYVMAFPHVVSGQQRYHSALLKLGIVLDSDIVDETGNQTNSMQLGGRSLSSFANDQAESISFELLARESEAPVRTPLHFTTGPVRINEKTGQRESMRLDMAECVRWATPDLVEGIVNGSPQRLVRQRWWLSIGALRLICSANCLECTGLDSPGAPSLEWVACLVDEKAPANAPVPEPSPEPSPNDALEQLKLLMESLPAAVTGGSQGSAPAPSKPKTKKKAKEEELAPAAPEPPRQAPVKAAKEDDPPKPLQPAEAPRLLDAKSTGKPPPPSRTLALPSALIDSWCQFARKNVTHVAEATGFVHFELSFDADGRRQVSPEHYIIAFSNREKGRQRYHSSLLTMRIVKENEIPEDYVTPQLAVEGTVAEGEPDYVEFELLLRVHEAPVQQQLRITAGPVRTNPETGQRESMRIDLGRCVRHILTDVVDDPRGKRVVRNRWWICVETLRLVCTANALDCSALDENGKQPVEWVICLVDERGLRVPEAPLQQQEERNIDDLVSFISGKAGAAKNKKRKKKDKDKGKPDEASCLLPDDDEDPVAQVVAEATGGSGLGTNSQLQLQAAVRLLAEAAASCTAPQQAAVAAAAAAAAEAARKAAEAAAGPDAAAGQPLAACVPPAGSHVPRKAPNGGQLGVASNLDMADPTSRAFSGLAELETLLAGLRSEFAEGRVLSKLDGRNAAEALLQGGGVAQ